MESYEALRNAISQHYIRVAKALRLSDKMIYKWTTPVEDYSDSGRLSPLDRVEIIIETALQCGVPRDKALAPLHYLTQRFNLVVIEQPKSPADMQELTENLVSSIQLFAAYMKSASECLADNKVTLQEADKVSDQGWRLIRQLAAFAEKTKTAVSGERTS